jgi:hypothetical protein
MTVPYLQELYLSFCGINTFTPDGSIIQKDYKKNGGTPPVTIIYPSTFTVDNSKVGREVIASKRAIQCYPLYLISNVLYQSTQGASTICFNTSNWKKSTFPHSIMRDAVSNRYGTLMHSKVRISTLSFQFCLPCTVSDK